MYNLQDFLITLNNYGLTDVILPFLLVFTIIFAVMEKTKPLGTKKNFNVIIALVISLLVVVPHVTGGYPGDYDVVNVINGALPNIALALVAVVALLILIGMFGGEAAWKGPVTGWVVILAALFVIWTFGGAAWGWSGWDSFVNIFGEETISFVVVILVFGIVIALITSDRTNKANAFYSIGEKMGELFGKR